MTRAGRVRSPVHQAGLGLASALVLTLLVVEGRNTGYLPTTVAAVAAGAACVVSLFVPSRRFALVAGCAVAASCVLSVVDTQLAHRPENTPGLTELCALLLIVARAVRRQSPPRAVALTTAAAVAALLLLLRGPDNQYAEMGAFVAPAVLLGIAVMVVLGLYLRLVDSTRDRLRETEREADRLEYARELHDFVAHHVTAIVTQAKAARYVSSTGHAPKPAELDRMLAGIEEAGSQAMESMRTMVSVLRGPGSVAPGRPGGDFSRVGKLVADFSSAGPPAELTVDPRLVARILPPEITTTVHRMVQESLTNIRKHAEAVGRVTVTVRLRADDPDRLDAWVTDDGIAALPVAARRDRGGPPRGPSAGFDPAGGQGGYGLLGLAERVEEIGGHLRAGRRHGGTGWEVVAELPLPPAASARRP